jgi:hypothetical protein
MPEFYTEFFASKFSDLGNMTIEAATPQAALAKARTIATETPEKIDFDIDPDGRHLVDVGEVIRIDITTVADDRIVRLARWTRPDAILKLAEHDLSEKVRDFKLMLNERRGERERQREGAMQDHGRGQGRDR